MRNKIKKNACQRKIITRTRQYLRGSAIYLHSQNCRDFTYQGKKTKCDSTLFFFFLSLSLSRKNYIKKTLITKTTIFISCAQDSQWATKRAKFFFTAWANRPKPLLHGLSLKKSPIKNHATSFRVGSSSGSNSTKLHKAQHSSQSFSWCYSF